MAARLDGEAYAHRAVELHDQGYNCAQSVLLAYAPAAGINEADAAKLMQSFGGGMGGLGETCGALSGGLAALGLLSRPVTPGDQEAKEESYRIAKAMGLKFKEEASGLHCPELKPSDPEARRWACSSYIALAARLVAEAVE